MRAPHLALVALLGAVLSDLEPPASPGGAAAHRVVFFGDSITERWPDAVPEFFEGRPWVVRGRSGQTTAELLARFERDVVDRTPEAVVILGGTNDVAGVGGPYREEETLANLAAMVRRARASGIRVVLGSVPPMHHPPAVPDLAAAPRIAALNARLRELARREGAVYVDYHAALADPRGALRPELGRDGVHPERAGYTLMGGLVERALGEALVAR